MGAGVPSLTPRPGGWRGPKENEETQLTTQHDEGQQMRKRIPYTSRARLAQRSQRWRRRSDEDLGILVFSGTHMRGVSAGHSAFSAFCIPSYAEATGQWDCCCCTISFLLRLALIYGKARLWTGAGRHYDLWFSEEGVFFFCGWVNAHRGHHVRILISPS